MTQRTGGSGGPGGPVADIADIGVAAGRGLRWSLGGTLVLRLGSFTMGLVLARLLVPEDFGVYAVALVMLNVAMHLNDVGVIAATVQWRGRVEEMVATGTTLALVGGLVAFGIAWFTAPVLAQFAGSPDATAAIRLLAVVVLVDGITAVRAGALVRRFAQDRLTGANLAGFAVNAALAITLAAHGAGAMAFVGGQVAGAVVTGALVLWLAGLPPVLGLDRVVLRRLLVFGTPLALSLGLEAVLLNIDYLVVGRLLGTAELGLYLLAFNLSSWLQGLAGQAIRWVSVPAFSRLAEREGALAEAVHRSFPLLVALAVPGAVLLAVLAPALVAVLYGATWAPAAAVLQFLAVLTLVRLLLSYAFDVLTSAGATVGSVWLNVGWLVPLVPALVVGTRWGGITGTAAAHALVAVTVACPIAVVLLRRCGVRLAPVLPALVRPLAAGALMTAACVGVRMLTPHASAGQLVLGAVVGLSVYLLVAVPRPVLADHLGRLARPIVSRMRESS
ncbi:MAG: oligosaccharide flippase family protein [Pseudonocardia sp.]